MATYNELQQRIDELKSRTGQGSISPEDNFSIMSEILDKTKAVDMTAQPLVIVKSYDTLALANADKNPINPATNKPLVFGQLISVTADGDNNAVYRLASLAADGTPTWEKQSQLGDMSQYAKSGGSIKTLQELDNEKQDVLEDGDITTSLIADNSVTEAKIASEEYVVNKTDISNCISELFIHKQYAINPILLLCNSTNKKIYIWGYDVQGQHAIWRADRIIPENLQNGEPFELIISSPQESNYKTGDVIGYIIFKDIDTFRTLTYTSGSTFINLPYVTNPSKQRLLSHFYITELERKLREENIINANNIANIDNRINDVNSITEQTLDEENSHRVLNYCVGATSTNPIHTTSTFSGFSFAYGVIPAFRYLKFRVLGRSFNGSTAPVTKVLIKFRESTYDGTILYHKTFDINVGIDEFKDITVDFGESVDLQGKEVYVSFQFNSYATLYRTTPNTISTEILNKPCRYFENGNISLESNGSNSLSSYSNAFIEFFDIYAELKHISTNEIQHIGQKLGLSIGAEVVLPDKIYAVVGDTLQLFYRGIIKTVNPYNFDILVTCSKGKAYPRYFEYTPTSSDVGTTSFKITIKDNNRKVIAEKSCSLITKEKATSPSTKVNIACFGDSLTSAGTWCKEADRRLTGIDGTPAGEGLTNIEFVGGKKNGTTGYFGVGGWTWDSYITQGRPAYRFQVSGVTTLSVGAVYSHNGNTFTIMEVNVTNGTGNILCSVTSLTPAPTTSGTLTKTSGTGDATISFNSVAQDSQNPLWDYQNSKMTFIPYANTYANGQIDVVYTLLSWNDVTAGQVDFSSNINKVKVFADTLHTEFPNAKLKIMGIQVPSINGGMGANYGATGDYSDTYGMVVTVLNRNKAYQDFANSEGYSDFVEFVCISTEFDSDNNMPEADVVVNTRSTKTEKRGTNGVHPTVEGYMQIADTVYRNIVANFCQ